MLFAMIRLRPFAWRLRTFYRRIAHFLIVCCVYGTWAQSPPQPALSDLQWRLIGPFRGGRVLAVTGTQQSSSTFYFGAVGGSVWKTTDAGMVWKPIFDGQHIASIGAIAVAPSNPNVIYVGSGEADMRAAISFGDGIYKSTDAGRTWTHVGLRDSQQIGKIVVDPGNPNRVFVAALGHAYGPNAERGVYRSLDGGANWRKVLDRGPDVGAIDLTMAPGEPNHLYAALWNVRRPTWSSYAPLEGPGSGLFASTDGGSTWKQLSGHGLPGGKWGRVGIDAAAGGKRVYALIEAPQGGLFRSDNGGVDWKKVGGKNKTIQSRSWYFSGVTIDPKNADTVYLPNVGLFKSTDGGESFSVLRGAPGGDDYHTLWIDPRDSARMILGTDQGASITLNGGETWSSWYNQPTAQLYHVVTDNAVPYQVYGAQQDSGTAVVRSRDDWSPISEHDFSSVGGAESGYIAPDPRDPDVVYVNNTYGTVTRFDGRLKQSQTITPWPEAVFGGEINQRKFRNTWTSPLVFSPADPTALYFGTQYLLKTVDGGLHWQAISPDLTGDARGPMNLMVAGEPTVANAKTRGYGVIYTIAPSPLDKDLIWTGSDTGLAFVTRDGGKKWDDVTPPGLSDWSKITFIEASHFDPGAAYAVVDRHRLDDYRPYLYRTRDFGKTWTLVVIGLKEPAFLNGVREDPVRRGLLYAATELGVAFSWDDGEHWQPLQSNLPTVSVRDLAIHGDDLVIATFGRSFWILDNISPLRQLQPASMKTQLLRPVDAVRGIHDTFPGTPLPPEIPQAKNPPDGAVIDYYLETAGDVTVEILDSHDEVVRRFSSQEAPRAWPAELPIAKSWLSSPKPPGRHAGLNRFVWNLRYPPAVDEVDQDTATRVDGPFVAPGTYSVRLKAGGQTYTQPLVVKLDPRSRAAPEEIAHQTELAEKAWRQLRRASALLRAAGKLAPGSPVAKRVLEGNGRPLKSVISGLTAVINAAMSADRQPPQQAYELYEQCAASLEASAAALPEAR